ncbi:DUF6461 domain-containing protein [Actinokineospora sp. 24-640]
MRELIGRYDWVRGLDIVLTFAVVVGSSADDVVRVYGGDPAERLSLTMAEAEDAALDDEGGFYFQVFQHGTSVVAVENNGWSGTVPEVARRASAGGRFLSVHWNANGLFRVTEAVNGAVTAYFEPGSGPAPDDVVPGWASSVGSDRATCLALVEAETGVAFDRRWYEARLPTYRIPDPDELFAGVEDARTP